MIYDVSLDIYVPVIYILMTGKTRMCYDQAFGYIHMEIPKLKPYCGGFDFESVFFKSGKTAFPGMRWIGCLFHFKKAN
jgi:hypothetical protein